MSQYSDVTYVRSGEPIDGIRDWVWIRGDGGAWGSPRADWALSHREKILTYVKDFRFVVQAGGNLGIYPRLLSNMFQAVYTFEPDPLNFYCLSMNCQKDNIVKIQAALGKENGCVSIVRRTMQNVGMHMVAENPNAFIPCLSLDSFKLPFLDLLMLDTEEYEPNIIQGAFKTIEKFKPVIFSESPHILDLLPEYKIVDRSAMDTIFIHKDKLP